jgi:SAM-dependent methyltransferase
MTRDERRLAETWTFIAAALPAAPARVLEIGCGPLGGFVPMLRGSGYEAVGVDPQAPDGPDYRRGEFEQCDLPGPVDSLIACTSLHHVADLDVVLDRMASMSAPGATVAVVEWAWERFDEATARWCFERLPPRASEDEHDWLHHHQDGYAASRQSWESYFRSWIEQERLHRDERIVRGLDARFSRQSCTYGPYFWTDLSNTSSSDEQAAIDAGRIQATGIRYVAHLPGGDGRYTSEPRGLHD